MRIGGLPTKKINETLFDEYLFHGPACLINYVYQIGSLTYTCGVYLGYFFCKRCFINKLTH